jgi:hypothetical protein
MVVGGIESDMRLRRCLSSALKCVGITGRGFRRVANTSHSCIVVTCTSLRFASMKSRNDIPPITDVLSVQKTVKVLGLHPADTMKIK